MHTRQCAGRFNIMLHLSLLQRYQTLPIIKIHNRIYLLTMLVTRGIFCNYQRNVISLFSSSVAVDILYAPYKVSQTVGIKRRNCFWISESYKPFKCMILYKPRCGKMANTVFWIRNALYGDSYKMPYIGQHSFFYR